MERVLPHQRDTDESPNCQREQGKPNAPKGLHERAQHPVMPSRRQVLQKVEVVADLLDDLGCMWLVAEALPQAVVEQVLVHG